MVVDDEYAGGGDGGTLARYGHTCVVTQRHMHVYGGVPVALYREAAQYLATGRVWERSAGASSAQYDYELQGVISVDMQSLQYEVATPGESDAWPASRMHHSAISWRNTLVVWGGYPVNWLWDGVDDQKTNKPLDDTATPTTPSVDIADWLLVWQYFPETKKWLTTPSSGEQPFPRYLHRCSQYEDGMYLYGGMLCTRHPCRSQDSVDIEQQLYDVYRFDLLTRCWTRINCRQSFIKQFTVWGHCCTMTASGRMVVIGGIVQNSTTDANTSTANPIGGGSGQAQHPFEELLRPLGSGVGFSDRTMHLLQRVIPCANAKWRCCFPLAVALVWNSTNNVWTVNLLNTCDEAANATIGLLCGAALDTYRGLLHIHGGGVCHEPLFAVPVPHIREQFAQYAVSPYWSALDAVHIHGEWRVLELDSLSIGTRQTADHSTAAAAAYSGGHVVSMHPPKLFGHCSVLWRDYQYLIGGVSPFDTNLGCSVWRCDVNVHEWKCIPLTKAVPKVNHRPLDSMPMQNAVDIASRSLLELIPLLLRPELSETRTPGREKRDKRSTRTGRENRPVVRVRNERDWRNAMEDLATRHVPQGKDTQRYHPPTPSDVSSDSHHPDPDQWIKCRQTNARPTYGLLRSSSSTPFLSSDSSLTSAPHASPLPHQSHRSSTKSDSQPQSGRESAESGRSRRTPSRSTAVTTTPSYSQSYSSFLSS